MIDKINYLTAIVSSLTMLLGVVSGFIIAFLKGKKDLANAIPNKLRRANDINLEMNNKLDELKELLNADRIHLYDFHNGGHYANGRSALKMSCTMEVVKPNVKENQIEMQNLPLTCFPVFLDKLYNDSYVRCDDVLDIKEDMPSTYNILKEQNIKSYYAIDITNKYNQPIAFLSIQYLGNKAHTFTREEINEIIRIKRYIEGCLEKLTK